MARTREPGGLTEKGAQLLKYIMLKEPRIISPLRRGETGTVPRSRPHWSPRTIWKQATVPGFITREGGRWQLTRRGFWALASFEQQADNVERILRIAKERFPEKERPPKKEWPVRKRTLVELIGDRLRMMERLHKDAVEALKIPNAFVACRVDREGRVDWLVVHHDLTEKEFARFSRFFLGDASTFRR